MGSYSSAYEVVDVAICVQTQIRYPTQDTKAIVAATKRATAVFRFTMCIALVEELACIR